jgi:ABC-type nitrate/sulfonate/bicarbonate transport system ATPase subunit
MKLEVKQISKSFGQKQVLNNIALQIKDGEFISLLGPSGSGKSTLFNLIGGLLPPDQGSIIMDGADITGTSGHISYMPQQPALLPWRTILGNVLLGQELYGIKETDKAVQMLEKAGLGEVADSYPHELSGGMKQRAAFIRALLSPQSLMLLDEPFSALDEFTRLDMQKWLLNIWEADRQSVLFITHSIEEALFLSDKIIILSNSPAKVKKVIDIPFARPRKEELLLSPDFLKWKRYVTAAISEWETSKI